MRAQESLQRLIDITDYLVDDKVGIIKFLGELPRESGGPAFYHYYAQACDTSAFVRQKNFGNTGGASVDRGMAMAKAIGEAIERYCAAIFDQDELPLFSAASAPFRCISPEQFALYGPQQYARTGFSYIPFTRLTPVRWTSTVDRLTEETWYVPASMVYIPYSYKTEEGESPIAQPISTGLACHCSLEEATISAIAEVIERDAFTITWQAKMSRPKIAIDTLSPQNQDLVKRFEHAGYSVTVLNITMEHGIPTILSVLQSEHAEMPAMVFAASASLNPDKAIRNSLDELAHTRRLATYFKSHRSPIIPTPDHENIWDQASHVHLYCDQDNFPLANFVFSSNQVIHFNNLPNLSTGDPCQDLTIYLERIRQTNHQVLVKDVTTPDVHELGLRVVRAIIPGFHPLFMGHALRGLGGNRLWEIPQAMGFVGVSRETGDNPIAHPYP